MMRDLWAGQHPVGLLSSLLVTDRPTSSEEPAASVAGYLCMEVPSQATIRTVPFQAKRPAAPSPT